MDYFNQAMPEPVRKFLRAYVNILSTSASPKSLKSMAPRLGVSIAYLRKLLLDPRWHDDPLRDLCQRRFLREKATKRVVAIIFETEWHKPSERPRSIHSLSIPTIAHLGLAGADIRCIIESEPYFPKEWLSENLRSVPRDLDPALSERPRWEIALAMLRRALSRGLRPSWILLDRAYGREFRFQLALHRLGHPYMAEVPDDFSGRLYPVAPQGSRGGAAGEIPLSPGQTEKPRPPYSVRDLSKGVQLHEVEFPMPQPPGAVERWQTGTLTLFPSGQGVDLPAVELIVLRNPQTSEPRFFVTPRSPRLSPRELIKVALSRTFLEKNLLEEALQAGFRDVRALRHGQLQRQLVLCSLSLLYRSVSTASPAGKSHRGP